MKDVTFLYRDEGTNGEWREREGRFRDVAQAVEWYGLGKDCDYRMVAVFDNDTGSYDWTWLDDVEDLPGAVPLCKLPEVDPYDPDPAEAARAASAMAVEEVLDAASAISPLIARLRYVDPANAGRPDEYRLVSADPEVLDAHGGLCHASVGDLVESSCDLKNGAAVGLAILACPTSAHGGSRGATRMRGMMAMSAESDDWKSTWRVADRRGDDAICVHARHDGSREFVLASGYDDQTGRWGSGEHFDSVASAAAKLENRAISNSDEVIHADFWCRDDIRSVLGEEGLPVTEGNVDAVMESLGLARALGLVRQPQEPTVRGAVHAGERGDRGRGLLSPREARGIGRDRDRRSGGTQIRLGRTRLSDRRWGPGREVADD